MRVKSQNPVPESRQLQKNGRFQELEDMSFQVTAGWADSRCPGEPPTGDLHLVKVPPNTMCAFKFTPSTFFQAYKISLIILSLSLKWPKKKEKKVFHTSKSYSL